MTLDSIRNSCDVSSRNVEYMKGTKMYSSSGHIRRRVHNLPARVGPGSKLEVALLVVKGEPGDVDLARRLERIGMMSMIT